MHWFTGINLHVAVKFALLNTLALAKHYTASPTASRFVVVQYGIFLTRIRMPWMTCGAWSRLKREKWSAKVLGISWWPSGYTGKNSSATKPWERANLIQHARLPREKRYGFSFSKFKRSSNIIAVLYISIASWRSLDVLVVLACGLKLFCL